MGILEDLDNIDRILKEAEKEDRRMDDITLNAVSSSQIAAVGFVKEKDEDTTGELHVLFAGTGKRWKYFGVSEQTYRDMLASPSIGRYFNQHIRGLAGEQVFS